MADIQRTLHSDKRERRQVGGQTYVPSFIHVLCMYIVWLLYHKKEVKISRTDQICIYIHRERYCLTYTS
jgi:hypothetical protein